MKSIRTYTGQCIDPLNLRPEQVKPADLVVALANTPRWGGQTEQLYSVAQHCLHVSEMCKPFGPKVALYGLLHDAAEAYLGDIRSPLKSRMIVDGPTGLEDFRIAEKRILAVILKRARLRPSLPQIIHRLDLTAQAAEARDLFKPPLIMADLPQPMPDRIMPCPPDIAVQDWLARLVELIDLIEPRLEERQELAESAREELISRTCGRQAGIPTLALAAGA